MFGFGSLKNKVIADEIEEVRQEIKSLRENKKKLEVELEEIKLQKRLETEEIKHLQKINDERLTQKLENEKIRLEKEKQQEITKLRDEQRQMIVDSLKEFHTKMEEKSNTEIGNLKEIYKVLLERLPNVNMTITKKITG